MMEADNRDPQFLTQELRLVIVPASPVGVVVRRPVDVDRCDKIAVVKEVGARPSGREVVLGVGGQPEASGGDEGEPASFQFGGNEAFQSCQVVCPRRATWRHLRTGTGERQEGVLDPLSV